MTTQNIEARRYSEVGTYGLQVLQVENLNLYME